MAEANQKAWTPAELKAFITETVGAIVAERLEPLSKRITDYGNTFADTAQQAVARATEAAKSRDKGLVFAGVLQCLAGTKCDPGNAAKFAVQHKMGDAVVKALEASTATAGGILIPEETSNEFIDLLTPRAIVRSFGTPTMPMESGNETVPKLTAASSAYYIGENRNARKSQPRFGAIRLSAKKLAVLVPISNSLIRRTTGRASTIVRNDALRSAALKEDVTFIRSPGGEYAPKGLRYLVLDDHVIDVSGSGQTLADVTFQLASLILKLEEANVAFTNPGWIFPPVVKQFLMSLRDGLGNYAFRAEMLTGNLWGYPFRTTTQIPRNLGTGGDETEVYLVDFDDAIIGETLAINVAVSEEASYEDENGDLVSAFSLDQSVLRLLMEHDFNMRHAESIAVLTGVSWIPTGS
jgi:HK97 family phage major capsid protein